jgi:hypothetical protein
MIDLNLKFPYHTLLVPKFATSGAPAAKKKNETAVQRECSAGFGKRKKACDSGRMCNFLGIHFPYRWLGLVTEILWRSSGLNANEFSLGFIKTDVHYQLIQINIQELKN